ncbi:MAG: helix-turn-helix domain-containing protein [Acidimicrobiales bacterium]
MAEGLRSSAGAGLLRYARHRAGLTKAELARRAGVPASMVSAYESDRRQATLPTLLKLLKAAGFELRMHLEPYDDHDDVLAEMEARRPPSTRQAWDSYQSARVAEDRAELERDLAASGTFLATPMSRFSGPRETSSK